MEAKTDLKTSPETAFADPDTVPIGSGSPAPFYIVGIGASAGGLEAIQAFFNHVAPDTGLAFVVIQHLSPDYKSLMAELLSRHIDMDVIRVEDGTPVKPNTVYLIPPKKNMVIFHGKLLLTEQDHSSGLNLPIDVFFRSLAEDQGETAIGIILSGTGSDGTRGVRAIKEAGGMVMVQEESTAKFDGMPKSAIATGLADFILPPEKMDGQLQAFVKNPYVNKLNGPGPMLMTEEDKMTKVLSILRRETGVDFTYYKPSTVVRRIERRMGIAQFQNLENYLLYLDRSHIEVQALYRDLLIGVTKFFRDREAFETMRDRIVPEIFQNAGRDKVIRAWCVGCATGEEAYSLAMLLHDFREKSGIQWDIKIFATDIDKSAIELASQGEYPESITADVPREFLQRYFSSTGGKYRINRHVRESVIFATQNILKDPPFTKLDIITCRNLLIYLQPLLQKKVLSVFHFALNPKGFLFLGSSETVLDLTDEFVPVDQKWRIFRHHGRGLIPLKENLAISNMSGRGKYGVSQAGQIAVPGHKQTSSSERAIEQITQSLLGEYVPSCLVLNNENELVHTFGRPSDLLRLPAGRASLNVLQLVPHEISLTLSAAIHKASRSLEPVQHKDVRFVEDGQTRLIDLKVERWTEPSTGHEFMLVFLEESRQAVAVEPEAEKFDLDTQTHNRIADLEQDLQLTRENLQATIEELETSNEELQATNEELMAANEELQSTNEELQSVNEELHTVNAEHQLKILELTRINNDIENLLRSTQIGTVFLDQHLRIRRFTPVITQEIHILEQDVGRPFDDLSSRLPRDVTENARQVLKTGETVEKTFQSSTGQWFLLRILPYLTEENEMDGVVLTFVNITANKNLLDALHEHQAAQQALLAGIPAMVFLKDKSLNYITANMAFSRMTGVPLTDLPGKSDFDLFPRDEARLIQTLDREVMLLGKSNVNHETGLTGADGQTRRFFSGRTPYLDAAGEVAGLVGIAWDISEMDSSGRTVAEIIRERVSLEIAAKITSALRDPIFVMDENGRFLYANPNACHQLGLEEGAVLGRHWEQIGMERENALILADQIKQALSSSATQTGRAALKNDLGVTNYNYEISPVRDASSHGEAVIMTLSESREK